MAASPYSEENVLRDIHDPETHSIRTTAEAIIIGDVQVEVTLTSDDDSVSIGSPDGARQAEVNSNSELLVHDTDANTTLTSIDGKVATAANQLTGNASLASIDTKVSTAANQVITNGKLDTVNANLSTIDASINDSQPRMLQDGTGNPITSQASSGQRALDVGITVAGAHVDPRQTRALTSSDTVTVVQPTGLNLHTVVDSSALPTGASTSALQTAGNATLTTIAGSTTSIDSKIPVGLTVTSGRLEVDSSGSVQPVSGTVTVIQPSGANLHVNVDASALPTGAATEVTLSTLNGKVPSNLTVTTNRLLVDGSGVTQPISAASLPLPTGAATEATLSTRASAAQQATANASLASIDGKTPAGLTVKAPSTPAVAADQALVVAISPNNPISLTGSVEISNDVGNPIPVNGTVAATQSGTWNINNVIGTVSLPTGASTSALQTTGNASLASIDTKTPVLGQALAAGSVPIVLTAAQLSTLTPLTTVTVTQATGTNLHTVVDSSALPTGAATEATLATRASEATLATRVADATITARLNTLGQKTSANSAPVVLSSDQPSIPVIGPLTDTQLRATPVPVSGSITSTVVEPALTPAAPATATVTTTSTQIVAANASRTGLVVTNLSNNRVFFAFGANTAVTNRGIALLPGGTWTMDKNTKTTQAVIAVANNGSNAVAIQEYS